MRCVKKFMGINLYFLMVTASLLAQAQQVELSQIFTTPSKVIKIEIPINKFISTIPAQGDCNSLPTSTIQNNPACSINILIDRDFRKKHLGPDYINSNDPMLVGLGYGPLVLEELKKTAHNGLLSGNLYVKYLYQPAWHTFNNHGSPATSVCALIEIAQVSFVVKTEKLNLEFKNSPYFNITGEPHNVKLHLETSLCPKL